MKPLRKLFPLFLICLLLCACGSEAAPTAPETTAAVTEPALEILDWADDIQPSADTLKQEVTVKSFIDGDTTHFFVPEEVNPEGVLKARYLAVNTPESTGKIEEYGKAASRFTREKLENAAAVLIESEDGSWNPDSTSERFLVWVWYKPQGSDTWRNLNVELLQEGLARANSSANNRYGDTCMGAIQQAKAAKVGIYSGEPDPDYYYGEAVELTLKELRCNIESYNGMKVAFTGIISTNSGTQGVYVEEFDPDTGMYFGIYVYYGHGLNGSGLDAIAVGNESRIVGTVQFYEAVGTWQVSDLSYDMMDPKNPNNLQKLSSGHCAAYRPVAAEIFCSSVTIVNGEAEQEFPWPQLALGTSLEMQGLTVVDAYTSDDGAITLTCVQEEYTVTLRTVPMKDENGNRITQENYLGKTVDVKGIVDYFDGTYQIKVFTPENITIK
jgi:endonuclease YncB( thermonuclease family)